MTGPVNGADGAELLRGAIPGPRVALYWIPLGAGTPVVQWNGKVYETLVSRLQRRPARDLYHSSLIVTTGDDRYAIEMTPPPTAMAPLEASWLTAQSERGISVGSGSSDTKSVGGRTGSSPTSAGR